MSDKNQAKAPRMPSPRGMGAGFGMPAGKAANFKKSIGKLVKFLKGHYTAILIATIFAAFGAGCAIFGPKIAMKIMEEISGSLTNKVPMNFERITKIGITLIILYAAMLFFNLSQNFILNGVTAKVYKKIRSQILSKINRMPLKYFDKTTYGDVLSRITNDTDIIAQSLSQSFGTLISSLTMIVGLPIIMFITSWQLTLINLASMPVSMVLMALIIKFSQKYFTKQQDSLGMLNGHIEEIYSSHNVVKAFSAEEKVENKFASINNELYKSNYKAQFLSGIMMPVVQFIGNLNYVFIVVVGGIIASGNLVFVATIMAFVVYLRMFNNAISQVATAANTLQSTAAASERIFEFLDEEELEDESNKTTVPSKIKGDVVFKNVHFGYNSDKEIIHNFNLSVKAGQKVAIVGPTGAGKTTIVNLLMRFYEISKGDILIDGVSVKNMKRETVRKMFGMVLQDTWLFEGTILENLKFGNPNASDEEVEKACKAANIDFFIKTLPQGYHMVLDEDANISLGQKQLLTIARAMVQNPPMMILDEATSSIDTRSEILIQNAMDKLVKNRTSFVIAHRLSTIKNADLILVMKDGNIIETGSHKELMNKKGFYSELYNSQFSLDNN